MKKEYLDLLNARVSRECEYYSGQKNILDYVYMNDYSDDQYIKDILEARRADISKTIMTTTYYNAGQLNMIDTLINKIERAAKSE